MTSRSPRRPLTALVALAVAAATAGPASAAGLPGTPAEQQALQSAEAGKLIRAREQADAILAQDPKSIVATFVLGVVFHTEEANHPRALVLVRRAKALLVDRYGPRPSDPQARIWHKRILIRESWILGEMDHNAEQIDALDDYDALYSPKRLGRRIWPLMKLGRVDEARAVGEELTKSDDVEARVSAYNGLMALEDELLDRRASYARGKAGIAHTHGRSCILFHNSSQAALSVFRFDESERFARKAIKAERRDCPNSSYEHLANLYLLQGEFQKAISAFEKLIRWPIERRYRPLFHMNNRSILVEVLFALGKFGRGLELAEQVYNGPDRTGMTSVSSDDVRFGHGVALWQLLQMRIEGLRDEASIRGLVAAAQRELQVRSLRLRQWEIARTLLRLSIHDDLLVTNLRPYLRGVKPWYAGTLVQVMGTGLARVAVDEARRLDSDIEDEAKGYYQAMYGEIAFRDGDWAQAEAHGRAALEALPTQMRLLAWRTQTWLAASLREQGRAAEAMPLLREVLRMYPSAVRHLDVKVPVRVRDDGAPVSRLVAEALAESRRLEIDEGGFIADVTLHDAELQICLSAPDGFRFNCSLTAIDGGGEHDAERAVDDFHDTVLSPRIALTTSDINSLDGSTVRVNAEQALEGLLGKRKRTQGDGDEDE
ncbi:MAG: hypothetical protein CSA66_01615 [Proteobacteria bacterium]|nr:MAG: hypothetical protein CSA66_01615 [Pseudomonadota bacterium]